MCKEVGNHGYRRIKTHKPTDCQPTPRATNGNTLFSHMSGFQYECFVCRWKADSDHHQGNILICPDLFPAVIMAWNCRVNTDVTIDTNSGSIPFRWNRSTCSCANCYTKWNGTLINFINYSYHYSCQYGWKKVHCTPFTPLLLWEGPAISHAGSLMHLNVTEPTLKTVILSVLLLQWQVRMLLSQSVRIFISVWGHRQCSIYTNVHSD